MLPEPNLTVAAVSTLGIVGVGMIGHALADELGDDAQPEAVIAVPAPGLENVGVVVDPSSITGPGGLIVVAWVLARSLKDWQPNVGVEIKMDDRTHSVMDRLIDRLRDRN